MTTDANWLKQEFARARERSANLPSFAKPVVVRAVPTPSGPSASPQQPSEQPREGK